MDKQDDSKCYSAWRKWEGYQIPATGEGEKQMSERWKAFKAGWFAKEKNTWINWKKIIWKRWEGYSSIHLISSVTMTTM